MDKKNTIIGILLIALAVGLMFFRAKNAPEPAPVPQTQSVLAAQTEAVAPAKRGEAAAPATEKAAAESAFSGEKQIWTLENGKIAINITSFGGGIETAVFKDFPQTGADRDAPAETRKNVIFNRESGVPVLTLAGAPAQLGAKPEPLAITFAVESDTTDEAAKTRTLTLVGADAQKTVRRIYTISLDDEGEGDADPYYVKHRVVFAPAAGAAAVPAGDLFVSTGMLPATSGDRANVFLNASWFNGDDYEKIGTSHFTASSGFLGLGAHDAQSSYVAPAERGEPFEWIATTNQYFANIVAFPQADVRKLISEVVVYPEKFVPAADATNKTDLSVIAYARIALPSLRALSLDTALYIGPKEYTRLAELCTLSVPAPAGIKARRGIKIFDSADEVVQFTNLFGFISIDWLCKILVAVMNWIHDVLIPSNSWSWGWAIVAMTVIVKGITWPLTMSQQRSARRMQKFQKPLQEIREKYKDNPQKMQQETMKLYRTHKINPLAGCFPVLIQIPIFFAMYCTFQTCAELRLQPFLWISDLSMPDLIPGLENVHIPLIGVKIHILPILMGATMLLNMKLTPMPNAQPSQKNMFYAMMIIFPIICYAMPSALTLYWTLQNIFTMIQSQIVRRSRDPETDGGNEKKSDNGKVEIIPPQVKKKGHGKGRVAGAKS